MLSDKKQYIFNLARFNPESPDFNLKIEAT